MAASRFVCFYHLSALRTIEFYAHFVLPFTRIYSEIAEICFFNLVT